MVPNQRNRDDNTTEQAVTEKKPDNKEKNKYRVNQLVRTHSHIHSPTTMTITTQYRATETANK